MEGEGVTAKAVQKDENPASVEHAEKPQQRHDVLDIEGRSGGLNAVFENPLAGVPREQLLNDVERFCRQYGLEAHLDDFRKGALISQNPQGALDLPDLTEADKEILRREQTHKWSQPWQLYFMACKWFSPVLSIMAFPCPGADDASIKPCALSQPPYKVWMRPSIMAPRPSISM